MNHGSLFSGIGGFDLAADWMNWNNIFQCEIDPYCQKILKRHFPLTTIHNDIKTFDGTQYRGTIDILSGGFPCQPYSLAGQRKKDEDPRALWPEMFRIIREIQPAWIVAENVPGILGLSLRNILTSLESEGYRSQTFIIPNASQGTWDRRYRVWIIANLDGLRCDNVKKRQVESLQDSIGNREIKEQKRGIIECGSVQSDIITSDTSLTGIGQLSIQQRGQNKETDTDIDGKTKGTSNIDSIDGGGNNNSQSVKAARHGINVSGALATLTARAYKDTPGMNLTKGKRKRLDEVGRQIGNETGLKLHPAFAEVMQGFPIGWTELKD